MSGHSGTGAVALVSGGGSGIGRAACQRLAADGAAVVVADLNGDSAARTVALIEAAGGRATAVVADIASEAGNAHMFDAAEREYGGVDMAFLNAGTLQPYIPFDEVGVDLFDRVIAVNLRGTFLGVKQALERLRPAGACVVTASAAGVIGFSDAAAYSISKHGLVGLVRSSAAAFAARSLRINAICPGMVLTPMNGVADRETIEDPDGFAYPDYRGGLSAQQVAEVAIFLMGRRSAGVNGQAQLVDAALLSSFPPITG